MLLKQALTQVSVTKKCSPRIINGKTGAAWEERATITWTIVTVNVLRPEGMLKDSINSAIDILSFKVVNHIRCSLPRDESDLVKKMVNTYLLPLDILSARFSIDSVAVIS